MPLSEGVDIGFLATKTQGFVGADIAQLCSEAAMSCIRSNLDNIDLDEETIPIEVLAAMRVTPEHFERGLRLVNPSSLRDTIVEIPNVPWESIGGLEDVKQMLQEMILYPVEHPEKFEKFGLKASKGVLFYGPPGCGKTLLAKAVATECSSNFISVKGPELLTMWFGESEGNVREVFDKARAASPCVLFFDELDSIAKERGSTPGGGGSSDRVVNALLTEMDGVGPNKNVFFIGATNIPELLDSALMRPGRLDQLLYIPLPDSLARIACFKAQLRKCPVSTNVNFEKLAEWTEGFSGADIKGITERAVKEAVKEWVVIELEKKKEKEFDFENYVEGALFPVADVGRKHFEIGLLHAHKTVDVNLLAKYEKFRALYDPTFKKEQGIQEKARFFDWKVVGKNWKNDIKGGAKGKNAPVENDDDLYN